MVKKITLLLAILIISHFGLCGQALVNRYCTNDKLPDVVLVHYAMRTRFHMTSDQWQPYVVHTFSDGHKEWLFQGFITMDIAIGDKKAIHYLKRNDVTYAQKSDWQDMIDKLFLKGRLLDALDQTIENNIKEIGNPPFRHKIIMGIPIPIKNMKDWGTLDGTKLDFSKDSDRVKAVKWFIDEFLKTYKKHQYKHFDLDGFYWVEEDTENTAGIPVQISAYIHKLGYTHYWAPYLAASGSTKWAINDFDYCYTQPGGYNFNLKRDISRWIRLAIKPISAEWGL